LNNAFLPAYEAHGNVWGGPPTGFEALQDFLYEFEFLDTTVDPSMFYIDDPEYWEEINNFDADAIRKQAQEMDCN
jgi:hypothetical protein